MENAQLSIWQSYSVRAGVVGILVLILLIPLAMVGGVIDDRRGISAQARHDIMRAWGREQTLSGPILIVPYRIVTVRKNGETHERRGRLRILPESVSMDIELEPSILERGIHEFPVYTATAAIRGEFAPPDVSGLDIDAAELSWERAYVALAITDAKAIRNTPEFVSAAGTDTNELRSRFEAGGSHVPHLPPQIFALVPQYADAAARNRPLEFSIDLEFSGTDWLNLIATAESTRVDMRSSWPSPSFSGAHLPEERTVTDEGFAASWRISNLGRSLPSRWTSESVNVGNAGLNPFGVTLYMPVDLYHTAERATKYGVLFIGLTFVCYFLFEVIGGLRLHPLQYLLVGFANTLFYLLLLSLAEHLGFGWSYLISAIASTVLITGYSLSVLADRGRAIMMLVVLALLYLFLYLTLNAETYAMLAGSIGLWMALALVMYLTRKIDWYQGNRQSGGD